jgi:hypothetical protein
MSENQWVSFCKKSPITRDSRLKSKRLEMAIMTAKIMWTGRQWEIHVDRLEGRHPVSGFPYTIPRKDVLKGARPGEWCHPWPVHMAEKGWVDREDFCNAWQVALRLYGLTPSKITAATAAQICRQAMRIER